jgi:flagellin
MNTVSAADDAAGVAIASRLTAEIKGTNQAIRNALDAQALIDTAEGAHEEIVNILQRMRELAVQGANDTNNTTDRANLKLELDALSAEVERIADTTTWAGLKLLDEAFVGNTTAGLFRFQIGSGTTGNTLSVTIEDVQTAALDVEVGDLVVDTNTNALATIGRIDLAITEVNGYRAALGSVSNRLDSTISNLTNISTNLEAGRGRIEDADFATETTNLARAQILQQASMAMLAQANASKQGVLSLLQR